MLRVRHLPDRSTERYRDTDTDPRVQSITHFAANNETWAFVPQDCDALSRREREREQHWSQQRWVTQQALPYIISRHAHSSAIWCGESALLVAKIDTLLASDCIGCLLIMSSLQQRLYVYRFLLMYLFFVSTDLHYSAMYSVLDRRGRVSKPLDWGFPLPHHWHGNSVARDTQNTIEICIWLYTRLNTVRAVMPRDIKILICIQSVASKNSVMYI